MSGSEKRYRTLYGQTVTQGKVVGYCCLHKVYLTANQINEKRCVPKKCGAFRKWDCAYWQRKERMRELRQMKKEAGIPPWEKVEIRTDREGKLLPKLKKKR